MAARPSGPAPTLWALQWGRCTAPLQGSGNKRRGPARLDSFSFFIANALGSELPRWDEPGGH